MLQYSSTYLFWEHNNSSEVSHTERIVKNKLELKNSLAT